MKIIAHIYVFILFTLIAFAPAQNVINWAFKKYNIQGFEDSRKAGLAFLLGLTTVTIIFCIGGAGTIKQWFKNRKQTENLNQLEKVAPQTL